MVSYPAGENNASRSPKKSEICSCLPRNVLWLPHHQHSVFFFTRPTCNSEEQWPRNPYCTGQASLPSQGSPASMHSNRHRYLSLRDRCSCHSVLLWLYVLDSLGCREEGRYPGVVPFSLDRVRSRPQPLISMVFLFLRQEMTMFVKIQMFWGWNHIWGPLMRILLALPYTEAQPRPPWEGLDMWVVSSGFLVASLSSVCSHLARSPRARSP